MGSTLLVKPGLVKGPTITAKTAVTRAIGVSGGDYYIKVMRANYDFFSPTEEITGDGDAQPCFGNSHLLYGNITLVGAMVAAQAIGIKNISSTTKNPVGGATPVIHYYLLGGAGTTGATGTEKLSFTMIVDRIRVNWNRVGRYVGVAITGKMTDMTDAMVAAIEVGV